MFYLTIHVHNHLTVIYVALLDLIIYVYTHIYIVLLNTFSSYPSSAKFSISWSSETSFGNVVQETVKTHNFIGKVSSLERVLAHIISHTGQTPCICSNIDPRWSFSSQILTVPFVWRFFPYLKEVGFRS